MNYRFSTHFPGGQTEAKSKWVPQWRGNGKGPDRNEREKLRPCLPCPCVSLFCCPIRAHLTLLHAKWLLWSLTGLGSLAELNSVDGLGKLGNLIILILHMHNHRLWTPQDLSISSLQGDLERKGSQCLAIPFLLYPIPQLYL